MDADFQGLLNKWQAGHLTDRAMALCFFLTFHQKKYPNPKLKNFLQSGASPLAALEKFQFKKVKGKALHCLKQWVQGHWQLKLAEKLYLPQEILQFQAQGIRPVSMLIQNELKPILHRSDCLDFFIHDLEHGYMFFADKSRMQMQIDFFKKIQASMHTALWDDYLNDQSFVQKFHYLISDMNTHIEHYRGYLLSMIKKEDIPRFEKIFFA